MRGAALGVALATVAATASAQEAVTVATCLRDGYEVKAAFSDNSGGAYLVLQKGSAAFMCHSNPLPRCEKLS